MRADLREALRQLRRAPGITATAIVTLALGIGATTAIFTLVHQVMLKSLPVTNPFKRHTKIQEVAFWMAIVSGGYGLYVLMTL